MTNIAEQKEDKISHKIFHCPKCGSDLRRRTGQYGEFLACPRFPSCRYTVSVKQLKRKSSPLPLCSKCNDTRLLPFVKNGVIIPNVFVDCECKLAEDDRHNPDRYNTILPEDIDFPVSMDCYQDMKSYFGWRQNTV